MSRVLKFTRNSLRLQIGNVPRAYSTLPAEKVDKVEYIPGVQGYAPGFGPPPLKPLTERKLRKKTAHLKKKMVFVKPKTEEAPETTEAPVEAKEVIVPETLAESISVIKQNIDVDGLTYKNKLHLIRHQYALEMQQLKKKQAEKAEKEAAEAREKQLLEEKEKHDRAQALHAARRNDHLSSLNLPESEGTQEEAPKKLSPFVDPELKASRIAAKSMNHSGVVNNRKGEVKESLLRMFYEATDYVTPDNIDAKLDLFINNGNSSGKGTTTAKTLVFSSASSQTADVPRESLLLDTLQGTINGMPGVEKLEQNRSSGELASDL